MNILLDIITLVIFIFSVYRGYKKGFVKTILSLCGGIVCLILAISLSPAVSNFINQKYISPTFERVATEKFSQVLSEDSKNEDINFDKLIQDQPSEFLQILDQFGVDLESLEEKFEEFKTSSSQNTSDSVIKYIVKPISSTISYVIAFIIVFLASILILSIVTFLLDKISKLPLLKTANRLLGVISGILFALLLMYVFSTIVKIAVPYLQSSPYHTLSKISPENTFVFKYFYQCNPIHEIIKALFKKG